MAERVAHRLLDDPKSTEFDIGGEANHLAGNLQIGMQIGLLVDVSKEAGKCSDQAELVEGGRSQVISQCRPTRLRQLRTRLIKHSRPSAPGRPHRQQPVEACRDWPILN